jgi:hypothetical protein
MIAGTRLCLHLATCLVFSSKWLTNVHCAGTIASEERRMNEQAHGCGKVNNCNAIKVSVWERQTLGQDVDAFVEGVQSLVSKYY